MQTDNQKTKNSESVRIYEDKKIRLERVRRQRAVIEDRNVTEISVLDEILEEGLKVREQNLNIA